MKTQIIADCCNAHEGNRELMDKMIKTASDIGCDYVKFQLYDADNLNPSWENYKLSYQYYKKCQLNSDDCDFIIDACKRYEILPLFTVFDMFSAKFASNSGYARVKIASPDCNNWDLIKYCTDDFMQVFVSLGMHHGYEIKNVMERYPDIVPMHCRSLYPLPNYTESDIRAMEYLKLTRTYWGLSDHLKDSSSALAIMRMYEPDFIERHFVLEKTGSKDDCVSSTPEDMARLTNYPFPELSDEEILNRKYITRWNNE